MKRLMVFLLSILITHCAFGTNEKNLAINFSFVCNDSPILQSRPLLFESFTIKFDNIKFYITNISLLKNDSVVFTEKNSFHLINIFEENRAAINMLTPNNITYDQISYTIGVDSITNEEGVKSGDLDPLHGMYWTWHSGYINCKIEGEFIQNSTSHTITLHLGGFKHPFTNAQNKRQPLSMGTLHSIKVDLYPLLQHLSQSKHYHIMSPSYKAVEYMKIFSNCIQTP